MSETTAIFVIYISLVITLGLQDVTFTPTQAVPAPCSYYLNTTSGVIEWPPARSPHPNGVQCRWIINVSNSEKIKLSLETFVLSEVDHVQLYDTDPLIQQDAIKTESTCNAPIQNGTILEVTSSQLWLLFVSTTRTASRESYASTYFRITYSTTQTSSRPSRDSGRFGTYYKFNNARVFYCKFGYWLIGPNSAICRQPNDRLKQSSNISGCVPTCKVPDTSNFLISRGDSLGVNSSITFLCTPPYILKGSTRAWCYIDFTGTPIWEYEDETTPQCVSNDCTTRVILTFRSGTIASPIYNTNSPLGAQDCSWIIESPVNTPAVLSLNFLKLDIPRGNAFLEVIRMDDSTSLLLLRHGDNISNWTTEAASVEIRYKQSSEGTSTDNGFLLEYSITATTRSKKSRPENSSNVPNTTVSVEPTVGTKDSPINYGTLAAGIVVPLVIISVIFIVVYIWYRKKYPVRMILGKQFSKFSNPAYQNKPSTTFTLEREVRDKDWELPVDQLVQKSTDSSSEDTGGQKLKNGEVSNKIIHLEKYEQNERQLLHSKLSGDSLDSDEEMDNANTKMELGEAMIHIEEDRKARTNTETSQTESGLRPLIGDDGHDKGVMMDNPAFTMDDEDVDSKLSAFPGGARVHGDDGLSYKTMSPMDNPAFSMSDEEDESSSDSSQSTQSATPATALPGHPECLANIIIGDQPSMLPQSLDSDENNNSSYRDSNINDSSEDVNNNLFDEDDIEMQQQQSSIAVADVCLTLENVPNYGDHTTNTVLYPREEVIVYMPNLPSTSTVSNINATSQNPLVSQRSNNKAESEANCANKPTEGLNMSTGEEDDVDTDSLNDSAPTNHTKDENRSLDENGSRNYVCIDDDGESVSSEEVGHVYSDGDIDGVLSTTLPDKDRCENALATNDILVENVVAYTTEKNEQLYQENHNEVGCVPSSGATDSDQSSIVSRSSSCLSEYNKKSGMRGIPDFLPSSERQETDTLTGASDFFRSSDELETTEPAECDPIHNRRTSTDYQTVSSEYIQKPSELDSSDMSQNDSVPFIGENAQRNFLSRPNDKKLIQAELPNLNDSDSDTSNVADSRSISSCDSEEPPANEITKTNDDTQYLNLHYAGNLSGDEDEVEC